MCGRFTLTLEAADIEQELGLAGIPMDWQARFNIAPTQPILSVADGIQRKAEWMRWGLIPGWAKDMAIGNRLINARAETINEKPAFRQAFARRRCLIPADGFYEWQHTGDKRSGSQPFRFHRKDGKPFMFAGLWEIWRGTEGNEIHSCTIITCDANELVSSVHNRMPVMLNGEKSWRWLESTQANELLSLLKPYPTELMEALPVSPMVNNPKQDSQELVLPLAK
jgi:putative SOS response-associated peptidase YedK